MANSSKIIVTIIVVVIIIAGGVYYWKQSKSENKILPTQTSKISEIKDWQTFTSEVDNYFIQYPSHWKTQEEETQFGKGIGFYAKELIKVPDDYRGVSIVIADLSLEDFINRYEYVDPSYKQQNALYEGPKIVNQEKIILDGIEATKLTGTTDDGSGQNFIFAKKDDISYIIFFHDYYDTNLKMISTFKFLK